MSSDQTVPFHQTVSVFLETAPCIHIGDALMCWQLSCSGMTSSVNNHRLGGDARGREEIHAMINDEAMKHYVKVFEDLFIIPEDNVEKLRTFFESNGSIVVDYWMPIPEKLRLFAPHIFDKSFIDYDKVYVGLNILQMRMNDATNLGIHKRLLAARQLIDYNIPFCSIGKESMYAEFKKVVLQICSFMRKPVAYINRGIIPPMSFHQNVFYFAGT
eukprot:3935778-Rhodomonas_salina.1